MIPDTTPLAVVEIFSPTWTGGFVKQCWFVAEFPEKEYTSIVISTDNKVFGVPIGERCGCFWRFSILGGIDTDSCQESHSSHHCMAEDAKYRQILTFQTNWIIPPDLQGTGIPYFLHCISGPLGCLRCYRASQI